MKHSLPFSFAVIFGWLFALTANSQISFRKGNGKLTTQAFHSGCPVTVIDWNNDGMDDIIRLKDGHDVYVEVQ